MRNLMNDDLGIATIKCASSGLWCSVCQHERVRGSTCNCFTSLALYCMLDKFLFSALCCPLECKAVKTVCCKNPTQTQTAEQIRINRRVKCSFFIRPQKKNAAHVFVHFAKIQIEEMQFIVVADGVCIVHLAYILDFPHQPNAVIQFFVIYFFLAAIVPFSTVTLVAE